MSTAQPWSFSNVITISTLVFLLMPIAQSRADFESGREAYLIGDYARALDLFLPSALQGNAKSQIGIGLLLARGHGTTTDVVRSYSWFDRATVESAKEHVVVRILARTNRDYLGKRMTAEQVAKAKLWSTMIAAKSELLDFPPIVGHRKKGVRRERAASRSLGSRSIESAGAMSKNGTLLAALPEVVYQIQLAAVRKNRSRELRALWLRLSKRYASLSELQPVLVRMDLGDAGVYEGLRAGPFEEARIAHRICSSLIADEQDCLVLAK